MIIFKQKEYVRQEAYQQLEENQKILPDPELVSRYGECKLILEEHKSFIKQRAKSPYKKEIKALVKDIKNHIIYMMMVRQVVKRIIYQNFLDLANL